MRAAGKTLDTGGRIPSIDGLRAVAVLAIIFYHLDESWLPGGFSGVDIFFVISGYVVAKSADRHSQTGLLAYASGFFRRRLLRIYPALFVMIVTTALLSGLFLPVVPDTRFIVPTGLAALAGGGNIFLYATVGDYFADIARFNPFTHTWSLGAEEQYYLIFPFLSWLAFSPSRQRARLGRLLLVAATAVSLAAVFAMENGPASFYLLPARFWEPGLGFLLYLSHARLCPLLESQRSLRLSVEALGCGLILLALVFADAGHFPRPWVLLPVIGAALLIASLATSGTSPVKRLLSTGPMQVIGHLSYALYLWHWVVIVALRWFWNTDALLPRMIALGLTFALAFASYRLVERPIRHMPAIRGASTGRFYAGFALVFAAIAAVSAAPVLTKSALSRSVTRDQRIWSTTALPAPAPGTCAVSVTTANAGGGRLIRFTPQACEAHANPAQLFIAGDSHAGAYWRSAYNLAARANTRVTILTKGGCPLLRFGPLGIGTGCEAFHSAVEQALSTASAGDILLLSSLPLPRYRTPFDDRPAGEPVNAGASSDAEKAALVDMATRRHMRLFLEAPKPILKTAVFRCADRWTRQSNYCKGAPPAYGRDELLALRADRLAGMRALAASAPGISIWDPFPLLCPGSICDGVRDGKPLFYDTDHLTGYGNEVLSPDIARQVLGVDYLQPGNN